MKFHISHSAGRSLTLTLFAVTRTTTAFDPGDMQQPMALQGSCSTGRLGYHVVERTMIPGGQSLDWIDVESQGKIAKRPLPLGDVLKMQPNELPLMPYGLEPITELEKAQNTSNTHIRGPAGTVPMLSCGNRVPDSHIGLQTLSHPSSFDGSQHLYTDSYQHVTNYGAQGRLSMWKPYVQEGDEFSLIQMAIIHDSSSPSSFHRTKQTVEAGWVVMPHIFGDDLPHLFTFFTVDDYEGKHTDDNMCWGAFCKGWVQVDDTIYPGSTFTTNSVDGGEQYELWLAFQLYEGNWWLWARDRWVGYFPSSLFANGHEDKGSTLEDHATSVAFYGEAIDDVSRPGRAGTDMGSGQYPGGRWTHSAYIHNIRYQDHPSETSLSSVDYDTMSLSPQRPGHLVDAHFKSGTNWGSYMWLGGPGADGELGPAPGARKQSPPINLEASERSFSQRLFFTPVTGANPIEAMTPSHEHESAVIEGVFITPTHQVGDHREGSGPLLRCLPFDQHANKTAAMQECNNYEGTQRYGTTNVCEINFDSKTDIEGTWWAVEYAMAVERHNYHCIDGFGRTATAVDLPAGILHQDVLYVAPTLNRIHGEAVGLPIFGCSSQKPNSDITALSQWCMNYQGLISDEYSNVCVIDFSDKTWAQGMYWATEYALEGERQGFLCQFTFPLRNPPSAASKVGALSSSLILGIFVVLACANGI